MVQMHTHTMRTVAALVSVAAAACGDATAWC